MSIPSPLDRITRLRSTLSRMDVDGFILLRGDEHLGEYVAPYAERLAWLTGFTGSAGSAIVLPNDAVVFSDGRYTQQLADQTDGRVWQRAHVIQLPPRQWLAQKAAGLRIGYDPRLISDSALNALEGVDYHLVALAENPVDAIWDDKPAPPLGPVESHPDALSGESSESKRSRIARLLHQGGTSAMIIGDPTSLAWLLNIRGTDVPHTPVALAFGILHENATVDLFVDAHRLTDGLSAFLGDAVRIHTPQALEDILTTFTGKAVRLDPTGTSIWFSQVLEQAQGRVIHGPDLCVMPKACKNKTEQQGARDVHLSDSAALCQFLHFVGAAGIGLSETALSDKLDAFRSQDEAYRGESFPAISAVGPNAALPHYRALPGQDRVLTDDAIYLIDSGGQYPAGTTDVTRTLWTGPERAPSAIREAFTRVLKGNIALSRARFPAGTTGHRLDALARQFLWQAGLDYDHGTGHGIGSYLSVHEGPQNISGVPRPVGLAPGMIVSNEPGYYEIGRYGIRLENLLLVREAPIGRVASFLEFEVLGFVPFDRQLIEAALLSSEERTWLDAYHAETFKKIAPLLDEAPRDWLEAACRPLD